MATETREAAQIGLEDEVLDDDDLLQAVKDWVTAENRRKALSTAAGEAKKAKDRAVTLLPAEDDQEHHYRVGGVLILVNPPGEPKEVEFTTEPKRRIKLDLED